MHVASATVVAVGSDDDHELTDPEISARAAATITSTLVTAPHCPARATPGAARIPETAQADPLPLPTLARHQGTWRA